MVTKKRYVLGFCFLPNGEAVLMLRTKDDWQKGMVNGIGGGIVEGEEPIDAMVREFKEETGVGTLRKHWKHAVTLDEEGWEMHVYRCNLSHCPDLKSGAPDEGLVRRYAEMPAAMEQTARWLYWMCRDDSTFGLLSTRGE